MNTAARRPAHRHGPGLAAGFVPPAHVPEGAKVVVVAFPEGGRGAVTHSYDLWLVDSQRWTGRLSQSDAVARLVAEGYREGRAGGKLRQAREKALRAAAGGRIRGPA